MEPLCSRVKGAIDDIGGEHVRRVWIGIAEEICEAHGWKRVVIIEEAFVKFHHVPNDALGLMESPWVDEAMVSRQRLMNEIHTSVKSGSRKL